MLAGNGTGGELHGFGDLEAVIMHRVWEHDRPVTVRELFDELAAERTIAYTTVMSTMDNLHRKGWLDRVKEGKAYRYTATASREEYSARLMREALADFPAARGTTYYLCTYVVDSRCRSADQQPEGRSRR